jgi:hypothetical protein
MTDDRLVQAVAEALLSVDLTAIPDDATLESEARELAEVAVAALVPLIRAQVASEIRAMPTHGLFGSDTYYVYREDAARIAEGTDHD